jgi:hypothetical protein
MAGLNDYKKAIIAKLSDTLKLQGFRRTGNNFQKEHNDLVYYIAMQSSQNSTSDTLKCTINIEMTSKTLYDVEDISIPEHLQRHYHQRIGFFMPGNTDKWWTIDSIIAAQTASQEIVDLLKNIILPELSSFQHTSDLKDLWASGNCPGLTDGKRREYLGMLTK